MNVRQSLMPKLDTALVRPLMDVFIRAGLVLVMIILAMRFRPLSSS